MKRITTLLLALLLANILSAQLPVSTAPQNQKAVIEHFTALKCGYSPDGDKIAAQLYNSNPLNVVLIQIHQGNWAIPSAGEPDFRTNDGNSIAAMPLMNVTAWPSASISRTLIPTAAINTVSPYTRINTVAVRICNHQFITIAWIYYKSMSMS